MKYKYFLTIEDVTKEASPINTDQLTIQYDAPSDARFSYLPSIEKKIIFAGDDFHFIYDFEKSNKRCRWVYLEIQKKCGTEYTPWQTCRIRMQSGLFDLDKCTVEFELEVLSNYLCYEDNKDIEVNLLEKIDNKVVTKIFRGTIEYIDYTSSTSRDFYKASEFSEVDPESKGWVLWKYTADNISLPTEWHYYYAREVVTVDCAYAVDPLQWIEIAACAGSTKTLARPVVFYKRNILGMDVGGRPPRLGYQVGPNFEGWLFEAEVFDFNTIDNGMLLADVLNQFSQSFCNKPIKSIFFNINPDATFSTTYPLLKSGKTWNLVVYQKSDVKRPNDFSNATKALVTMAKIIGGLCNTFNLQFTITDTEFRIEHISYFDRIIGLNSTASRYKKFGKQRRAYSYSKDKIPEKEVFEMMEQKNTDFIGTPIEYKGACMKPGQIDKIQTEIFTTDAVYTMDGGIRDEDGNEPGTISDSGLFLMATEKVGTDYFILRENGILDPYQRLNNTLAWAQLHRDYWKWERPQINGYMNGVYSMFNTSRPVKVGEKIRVDFCCGDKLKLTDYVKSILGNGVVNQAKFSLANETLELELLYRDSNATFVCLPVVSFLFDHVDGDDIYFLTTFEDSDEHITEIEVTKPDNTVVIVGPITESSGLNHINIGTLVTGTYKFKKRVLCGSESSPWSTQTQFFNESDLCTEALPAGSVHLQGYSSSTQKFTFDVLYSYFAGYSIEVEVTRPDSVVFIETAFGTLSGGVYVFKISKDKVPYVTGPTSGLYSFRFRIRCNSIAAGAWNNPLSITI